MKFSSRKDLFLFLAFLLGVREGSVEYTILSLNKILYDDSNRGELFKFEEWVLKAFDRQLNAAESDGYESSTQMFIRQVLEYHGFKRSNDGTSYKDSVTGFLKTYQGDEQPVGAQS